MIRAFRSSLITQIGATFFLVFVMYSLFLGISSYMTAQLIGVSTAIDQAGTERMRIYRLASLLLQLSGSQQPNGLRELIQQETSRWERVLEGLRHGTPDHAPVGEIEPSVLSQLQGLQDRWDMQLRPSIESATRASGERLEVAQREYLRHADEFVEALSVMVRTLEQSAAARTKTLYGLQILFLILSAGLLGGALLLFLRTIRRPLNELTRGAERLAAGELNATIAVQASDELGRLARTFEQMAHRIAQGVEELEALHATGQEISTLGPGGLEQVLRRIVDRAADLVHVDMAVIMVRHSVLECWVVEAASGQAFDAIRKQILLTEETPFSNEAYETKQPVVVSDSSAYLDHPVHFRDEFGAQSYLAVPLLGPHDCIGVLTLLSTTKHRTFSEWDIRLAQQFAAYAAVTIENARLFDAVQSESHLLRAKLHAVERNVAELTHEVKAPAGRVAEFASWIEADYGSRLDAKGLRYLDWIKKEGRDLAQLAERTLDLARITAAPSPLESVDTQVVVKEVLDLLAPQARDARITFLIAEDLPILACRRIHLKQVLENLISNAIKYMGAQPAPRVEVGWEPSAHGAVLYVGDNGIGIDPAMTDRIFDPFQRLCTPDIPGAGIGLSIVKTVVEQYDGAIWVDSKPGEGSRFYFRLPIPGGKSAERTAPATPHVLSNVSPPSERT
jgi:signal transduction histidine kinase/HAMP domain-containing protein